MPTYDYLCGGGHRYDKREPFGSPPEQPCDECGQTARRVIHAPPVVFKGSGWYKTDSRPASKGSTPASSEESETSEKSEKSLAAEAATAERESKRESNAAKKKAESSSKSGSSDKKSS